MKKISAWFSASLSRQLMGYSFVFTYLLLVSFWSILYLSLMHDLKRQDEALIRDRIRTITSLLGAEGESSPRLIYRVEKDWFNRSAERVLVRVLNSEHKVLAETPSLSPEQVQVLRKLDAQSTAPTNRVSRLETGEHIYATAVSTETLQDRPYRIELAIERTSQQRLLAHFKAFFAYILLIGGAASLWIGAAIVKIALKPAQQVSKIAARINSESLAERFHIEDLPSEFHEVAEAMNGMLKRLHDSFLRLTRFSEDMAHELRTPVNNLLGTMEVALSHERTPTEYRNILGSGIEECDRLKRTIESLLFIARSADPNQTIERNELKLRDELRDIVSFYEVSAEEKGIHLRLEAEEGAILFGERTHLQRCIGNLLSNSIRHSPEHSTIWLKTAREQNTVSIKIVDQGCGMPKAALERIGERFFRIESSRSKLYGGTGLGLSIAKSIVEMHGGKMLVASQEGVGTEVELQFPRDI